MWYGMIGLCEHIAHVEVTVITGSVTEDDSSAIDFGRKSWLSFLLS